MRFSFILLLFFLSFSNHAVAEDAELLPLAEHSLLLSIVKNGDDLFAVGERGHVLKSGDNGQTWQQIANVPTRATLTKITAQGQSLWAVGHDATIIHSADGGQTWQLQFSDPQREVPFLSALFLDEKRGFVIGAYGTILSTNDGGENWNDGLISEDLDYHLNDITELDNGELLIAAEAGYVFKSKDGGASWQAIELPYGGSMFGIQGLGEKALTYGLRGHVLLSNDQGETWQIIKNSANNSWFGSVVLDSGELLLLGADSAKKRFTNGQLKAVGSTDGGDDLSAGVQSGKQIILVGESGFSYLPASELKEQLK